MMARWLCWFLLVPVLFLLSGWIEGLRLPPLDVATGLCLFLGLFAETRTLPGLLLGAAVGRALVDDASLPVQVLVLGLPVAMLLPLRALVFQKRWFWQVAAAAFTAFLIPEFAGLCGSAFDQPSASAQLDAARIAWAALLLPPVLWLGRRLPPLSPFQEPMP